MRGIRGKGRGKGGEMKEYIVIKQVDNGWVIERNQYGVSRDTRETVVCVNEAVVVEHIERMLSGSQVRP